MVKLVATGERPKPTRTATDVPQEDFDHHLHHAGAKRSAQASARAYEGSDRRIHSRGDRHGAEALRAHSAGPDVARGGRSQEIVKIARWAPRKSSVTRARFRAGFGT